MLIEHKVEMEMLKEMIAVIEEKLDALAEMTIVYDEERIRLCERITKLKVRIQSCKPSQDKPF